MSQPTHGTETDDGAVGPVVRDRRRLDPETGKVRDAYAAVAPEPDPAAAPPGAPVGADAAFDGAAFDSASFGDTSDAGDPEAEALTADAMLLTEELRSDLQRLQAEYVNYRKRVERDRDVARDNAIAGVLEALLPVLDDVALARRHGDLAEGTPFAAIADKLGATLTRVGLEAYGAAGETFDPTVHEALMHVQAELAEGISTTTVVEVLQPGYRVKDRVLRAARVAVADPN